MVEHSLEDRATGKTSVPESDLVDSSQLQQNVSLWLIKHIVDKSFFHFLDMDSMQKRWGHDWLLWRRESGLHSHSKYLPMLFPNKVQEQHYLTK